MVEDKDLYKFYVYGHYDKNGNLFYIGKGSGSRAWSSWDRSVKWKERSADFTFKIYAKNLSNSEALLLEEKLILSNSGKLVNFKRSSRIKSLDSALQYFNYDESSNITHFPIKIIDETCIVNSHIDSQGYSVFSFRKQTYKTHRLVWSLFNGKIPDGKVVDHIDRDRSNNKISNLRLASYSENAKNRLFSENKYIKRITRNSKFSGYQVLWGQNGKSLSKTISAKNQDEETCFKLAMELRQEVLLCIQRGDSTDHLANKKPRPDKNALDLKSILYYDPNSETCLSWAAKLGSRSKVNTQAGSIKPSIPCIQINGTNFGIKAIVWILVYGEIPDNCTIVHKDGNVKNLRIENLELRSHKGYSNLLKKV